MQKNFKFPKGPILDISLKPVHEVYTSLYDKSVYLMPFHTCLPVAPWLIPHAVQICCLRCSLLQDYKKITLITMIAYINYITNSYITVGKYELSTCSQQGKLVAVKSFRVIAVTVMVKLPSQIHDPFNLGPFS